MDYSLKFKKKIFNETYYKTCFYNPFFSLLEFIKKDSCLSFISRDFFYYDHRTDYSGLTLFVNCIELNVKALCKENGILCEDIKELSYNTIQKTVSLGKYAMLAVDQYYLPFSPIFKIQHSFHYIAVFKKDQNNYYIIDTQSQKGCYFTKIEHKYLAMAIESPFLKSYSAMNYFLSKNEDDYESNDNLGVFNANIGKNFNLLESGLTNLNKGINVYRSILFNKDLLYNSLDNINDLGHLYFYNRTYKLAEAYRNSLFIKNNNYSQIVYNIANLWNDIKSIMLKLHFTRDFNKSTMISVVNKLDSIQFLEEEYLTLMERFINIHLL